MNKYLLILLTSLLVASATAQIDEQLAGAKMLYEEGMHQDALTAFDSYIESNKTNYLAYKLRGDCKQRLTEFESAILDYDTAMGISNEDHRLYVSRGAARMSLGKLKPAIKDFDRALDMDPEDADAWFNRGGAYYLSMDNKRALKDLNEALTLNPEHADALFIRGVVKGELYDEVTGIEDIEKALSINSDLDGAQMSLAVLHYELKMWEEAIAAFSKVVESKDQYLAEAFYYRGDCKYNQNLKEEACVDWRESAELGDKDAVYIVAHYCNTDSKKIPKQRKKVRQTTITF